MASDFDVIYEIEGSEDVIAAPEPAYIANVPDPVVIRGAGNITV
jgi:hypothetical protein